MKKIKTIITSLKSVGMKNKKAVSKLIMLILIFSFESASAANAAPEISLNDKISYSILIALGVVFIIAAAYVLTYASRVLRENGGSMNLSFPIFRKMSFNGNTVGIIFLIIVLAAIIWALNF